MAEGGPTTGCEKKDRVRPVTSPGTSMSVLWDGRVVDLLSWNSNWGSGPRGPQLPDRQRSVMGPVLTGVRERFQEVPVRCLSGLPDLRLGPAALSVIAGGAEPAAFVPNDFQSSSSSNWATDLRNVEEPPNRSEPASAGANSSMFEVRVGFLAQRPGRQRPLMNIRVIRTSQFANHLFRRFPVVNTVASRAYREISGSHALRFRFSGEA